MKSIIDAKPSPTAATDLPSTLANTVHELRTPLTTVLVTLELLQHADLTAIEQAELIECATTAALHLEYLIDDILDDAAIGAGHLRLHRSNHCVRDLLDEMLRVVRLQATDRRVQLTVAPIDLELLVHTDDRRFLQIALNLVGNALKFAPRGGRVQVDVDPGPTWVRFRVTDDGPGVPESARSRLFSPFANVAPDSPVRGTGLGLALCQQLVRRLGGSIGFEPRSPHGSVFWFELPRVVAPGIGQA